MHASRHDRTPSACGGTAASPRKAREAVARGPLTRAQQEVLQASATGLTSAEVGERLGLDLAVVRSDLADIVTKLGARSKLEAVVMAIRAGWIEAPA
jgi:DNA-binding NarL/FixJ family response regulator